VAPKSRAIDKIYSTLFYILPHNFCDENIIFRIPRRTFLEVASLLSWYSVGLKLGNAFVHSIFKSAGWGDLDSLKEVSLNCKRDVGWWKILSLASMKDPWLLSTDISSLRRNQVPDLFMATDASTTVGGGGWLGMSSNESSAFLEASIRWTIEEIAAFKVFEFKHEGKRVDINVLEFFTAMYMVMLWGSLLRGKVIFIQCDNTAAVSWLLKLRASNKSPIAETLVQLFSLFCIYYDITFIPSFLKGILNVKADHLSRYHVPIDFKDTAGSVDTKDEMWWSGQSREAICRNLLLTSVAMPWTIRSPQILQLLKALL
jgi:hypothetical protein